MIVRRAVAASVIVLSLTACATQEESADRDGAWVGTITTEGNVTTVINESGSVWSGPATMIEEASIGVESGDDNYMFARLSGVHATTTTSAGRSASTTATSRRSRTPRRSSTRCRRPGF